MVSNSWVLIRRLRQHRGLSALKTRELLIDRLALFGREVIGAGSQAAILRTKAAKRSAPSGWHDDAALKSRKLGWPRRARAIRSW